MSMSIKGQYFMLLVIAGLLSGCGGSDMSDLEEYVASIKNRPAGKIDPLPEIKPYQTYLYSAHDERDPFSPPEFGGGIEEESDGEGVRPDIYRQREPLEDFPLDTLTMVGILGKGSEDAWGLVQTNDGTIHRVKPGNYMGQNYGKIIEIAEDKITLVELVRSSEDKWIEREAALALPETE